MAKNIMEALVHVSEKAANIARLVRQNEQLLHLLTEEKSVEESNPRYVKDFKTLADVLVQETIRYEIGNLVSSNVIGIFVIGILFFCHVQAPRGRQTHHE